MTERVALLCGNSKALDLGEGAVDAVVTDPPYELGFMGKRWDATGIAYDVDLWRAILRVLKPGGHLLAFGGTRTYHRMACAIEDAGFEVRDSLHWVYGSGFPKSLNVSKAIDERMGAERPVLGPNPNHRAESGVAYEGVYAGGNTGAATLTGSATPEAAAWDGWGTALKPAHEPIILARKPLSGTVAENVLAHGTGALNVDGCRLDTPPRPVGFRYGGSEPTGSGVTLTGSSRDQSIARDLANAERGLGRWPANFVLSHGDECDVDGLLDGQCAPGCPVAELDRQSGSSKSPPPSERGRKGKRPGGFGDVGAASGDPFPNGPQYGDAGGASRFFYVAKPSSRERDYGCEGLPRKSRAEATDREEGSAGSMNPRAGAGSKMGRANVHPTVKPIELMRWLCRLITPPGGIVLDPFLGSGTTGIAAVREGFSFVGIELSEEYMQIATARIRRAMEEK